MMEAEFCEWWKGHSELSKVKYFSPREILYLGASNDSLGLNSIPDRELWQNIIPTVLMADWVRRIFGSPVLVISGYRNHKYNLAIGGAANSYHKRFMALDLKPVSGRVLPLFKAARIVRNSVARGGIGSYSSFIHLDCRNRISNW